MNSLQKSPYTGKSHALLCASLAAAAMLLLPCRIMAQVSLVNGDSSATINLTDGTGLDYWSVGTDGGQNQLNTQWFYYSVNGGAAQPINAIGLSGTPTVTGGSILDATYANSHIAVGIQYQLLGSGSSAAQILESISVTNVSSSAFNLKIFDYANFNLLQSGVNTISISPDYGPPPTFPLLGYNGVTQMSGSTALSETIGSPDANFAEAGAASGVLGDVTSGNNLAGPLTAGPPEGNVAWAFEWSEAVASGNMADVLDDGTLSITPVPEPSTVAIIMAGLGAFGFFRRRQSS